ncbi:DUF1501 domain-containing protein [Verrucomicrobiales bacterium]|nr:DUF1501 domain-containing protein [Verrucomicrobiales bacterium]
MSEPFQSFSNSAMRRRHFLHQAGLGFGSVALQALLQRDGFGAESGAKAFSHFDGKPQFAPKAKNVIWLFMRGGVSHMESFDPKPMLTKYGGKTIDETPYASVQDPSKLKNVRVVVVNDANGQQRNVIYPLQVGSKKYGQSGTEVSDWFPHIGSCVDDISVIRSMYTTDDNHGAQVQFHSGKHRLDPPAPTIGAWVNYGLGSLNDNLPQFVTMGPRYFDKKDGHYLGPAYDSVKLKIDLENPLEFAKPEGDLTREEQKLGFGLVNRLNHLAKNQYPNDPALEARIKSYELGYRMQTAVPDVINFDSESEETKKLYGLDHKETKPFGEQLLAARRLTERGVRFVQIMHGDGAAGAWDQHSGLKKMHSKLAGQVDKPVAGLLKDLKQRGQLDDTIVVFATEFGRTPGTQGSDGRDHHPFGFSVWMAGGGIKGGVVHGATDELGFHAVESPHYVTDVHATILHQLGLHSHHLEVPGHKRLDIDFGSPIKEIIA